jgi:WD40 repeat protein
VLDIQSGKVIAPLLVSPDSVLSLAISNDGERLAVGETNGSITIFDVGRLSAQGQSSGQLVCIDDHSDWINSLAWSTDDRWLVSASRDKTCKVFDAQSGKLLTTFAGHQHNATGALFTADGNHIASVGDDGRLRIWSRIEAKQESELTNVAGPIQNLATWGTDKALIVGVEQKLLLVDIGKKAKRIGQVELPANQNLCVVASASGRAYVGSHTSVISQVDLNNPNDLPRSFPARPMASPSANPSVD